MYFSMSYHTAEWEKKKKKKKKNLESVKVARPFCHDVIGGFVTVVVRVTVVRHQTVRAGGLGWGSVQGTGFSLGYRAWGLV